MKRPILLIVVLCVVSVSVQGQCPITDPALKACVEATLGKTDPNCTDIMSLTSLTCDNNGITNLIGLECAVNLQWLNLSSNQISDILPLQGLMNLQYLSIGKNEISNISSLAGLTNLQTLNLYDNQIIDISPICGLINLTYLSLHNNNISNISCLSNLTNLQTLYLYNNNISDISSLSGLTNLQWLELSGNHIIDISQLKGLTNLQRLYLSVNQIGSISDLSGLKNLKWLSLSTNQIIDISPLIGFTSLQYLSLGRNPLNNEAYCTHLQTIYNNNPGINLTYDHNNNPPENVTASDGTYEDKVRITWDTVCNVYVYGVSGDTNYRVYRSDTETGIKEPLGIDWQTNTTFDDTTSNVCTTYYYWIKAKTQNSNGAYGETDFSAYDTGWCSGEAPIITEQPSSQTVCDGNSVTFTVSATGTEPLSYHWRKDGSDIEDANSPSLIINSVVTRDAGNYECVVTNACGSVPSNTASLTVNTPPVITQHPQSQTVCEGSSATFCVTATGTEPITYQWRKGGVNIPGANSNCYTINPVGSGDAGSYDCVVTNICGSVISRAAILTLETNPTVQTLHTAPIHQRNARVWGQVLCDGGLRCRFGFHYGKTPEPNNQWTFTGWRGNVRTGDRFSAILTRLEPCTTYYYAAQLKQRDTDMESDWGEILSFNTLCDTHTPRVSHTDTNIPGVFGTIQEAIDAAVDGEVVVVESGIYPENIDFRDKYIILVGLPAIEPNQFNMPVIVGDGGRPVVSITGGQGPDSAISGFIITTENQVGNKGSDGFILSKKIPLMDTDLLRPGIYCNHSSPAIINCIISANLSGGVLCIESEALVMNCTIVGNRANTGAIICWDSNIRVTDSIIWDNVPYSVFVGSGSDPVIRYCDVEGNWIDIGNLNIDPLFVTPGYWADPNNPNVLLDPNDPNSIWIDGDYHLKPESPCIDAGDPNSPVGLEPEPNGDLVNQGAYGGTEQATKSSEETEAVVYIQWIGHSSVKLWTDDVVVYVDPRLFNDSPGDANLVLVTHTHGDHYSRTHVLRASNENTVFMAPPDVVQQHGSGTPIAPGETVVLDSVKVTGVPAYNINKSYHPRSNNWLGYVIELGGRRVYVAGDTDLTDEMKALKDIDVAILPVGGTYTMNGVQAAEATTYIQPALAIPYHWGSGIGSISNAQTFADQAACPVIILSQGQTINSNNWVE